MAVAAATRRFDVFLSHNSRDKPAVQRLAEDLKRAGLEPWLDVWCLTPGGRWQEELAKGLHESSACAVFVGPSDIGAWEHQELSVALDIAAKDPGYRMFLVLLPGLPEPFDPTVLSPFLSTRTWVDLRPGIASKRAFQALVNAIKGVPFGTAEPVARSDDAPPYRGLQSFEEGDAELFFGRQADTQRLVEKLKAAPFLAVLGRSGSGKSSLVRAGLVPALRAGVLPGSDAWQIELLRPGARPLEALAARAAHVQGDVPVGRALDELTADPRALHLAAVAALADAPAEARVVWVVDQFEEAFTLCRDQAARDAFVAALVHAASAPDGRSLVVLTMRADFYPACAAYPDLAGRVSAHQFLVGELSEEGLRAAIEEPARRVGLEFEEGLVETIVQDVGSAPGALPLLEHALLELWERRRGSMLTLEGYRESGGVQGALAERADAVFSALTPEQQAMARRALLRLTQPGEGTEDTRRRAGMDELAGGRTDEPAVAAVVQSLVAARLLTTTTDEEDGSAEIEVAHEALIRGWPRLRHWIDEDRAGLRIQHRLAEAAHEWETLGRDEGLLYRGARLAEAREWQTRNPDEPNEVEREFLTTSSEARDREARAAEARRRKEVRLLRLIAAVLLGGVAIAGVAALIALQQRSDAVRQKRDAQEQRAEAVRQKRTAQEQQRIGRSRELAATSALQLAGDPAVSLRTAVQAVDTAPTTQATEALRQALAEAPLVFKTRVPKPPLLDVAFDSSGRHLLVLPFSDADLYVLDARTGRRIGNLGDQTSVSWAPLEQSVGLGGDRRVRITATRVQLLDATRRQIARLPLGKGCTNGNSVAFTPDGRRLVTCIDGRSPAVWSALTGELLHRLPHAIGLDDTSLTIGIGNRALDYGVGGSMLHVDLVTGRPSRHRLPTRGGLFLFAAAGNGLGLAARGGNRVAIVDFRTGQVVSTLSERIAIDSFAFSPDRTTLAVAPVPPTTKQHYLPGDPVPTNNGQVDVFNVRTGGLIRSFVAGAGAIGTLAYSRDGRLLLSAGSDGVVRLWPRTGGELLGSFRAGGRQDVAAAFSPDARMVAVAAEDGSVRVWRLPLPAALAALRPPASPVGTVRSMAFAGRGLLLAAVGRHGALAYDAAAGRVVATLLADRLRAAGVSADGRRIAVLTPRDGGLRVFELPGSRPLMRAASGDATGVFLSADGRRVAARALLGGTAWNVGVTRPIASVAPMSAVSGQTSDTGLSADGRLLAVTSTTTGVTVVDLQTGRRVTVGKDSKLFTPAFSRDGRLVYATRDNGALWAYEWRTGAAQQVLASQEAGSRVSAHVSANGFTTERFADRVAVVELASEQDVELLGPFPAGVRAAQIAADGSRVAVLTKDGTLRFYGCPTCAALPHLLTQARERLQRAP